jgi:5-methylcytosine-specific restriction endonuclease McrA
MSQDSSQAIADLLGAIQKTDATLAVLSTEAESITQKYDPVAIARQQFNNWRSSHEGQAWKQEQFETFGGQCPRCGHVLPSADYFHIDHIEPLSKRPGLATELSNLQLLCGPCNLHKGSQHLG